MRLFAILIGNFLDDITKTRLVLSSVNLVKYFEDNKEVLGIKSYHTASSEDDSFVWQVTPAKVELDAWSEEDLNEGMEIISKLI